MRFGLHSVHPYYEKTLKLPHSNFKFDFVSEDYILKFLKNINEDKAAGIDNLSGKFLKDGAAVFAKPISQICNLSIKYSHFPMDCKIAKLKPLFKKGSRTARKNYRPISLLPLISKIIEKVIHDQTQKYLDDYNILYRYQSGFRKSCSADSCLSYLNNKIATGFESGLYTGMILIKKNNFMAPFYGWGSTASRLEPLRGGSLHFTSKFPDIPGTHFTDLRRMKAESTLEPANGFEHGNLGLGIQHLNH